jgi:hypothetical protein
MKRREFIHPSQRNGDIVVARGERTATRARAADWRAHAERS